MCSELTSLSASVGRGLVSALDTAVGSRRLSGKDGMFMKTCVPVMSINEEL